MENAPRFGKTAGRFFLSGFFHSFHRFLSKNGRVSKKNSEIRSREHFPKSQFLWIKGD